MCGLVQLLPGPLSFSPRLGGRWSSSCPTVLRRCHYGALPGADTSYASSVNPSFPFFFLFLFLFFFTFIKFHSRLLYAAGCQMSGLSGMSNANADLKGSTTALLRRLLRHKCAWGGTTTAATTTASSSASLDFSYCFFVALLVMEDEMAKPGCPTCERDRTPRFFSGDGPRALPCAVFFIGC